MPHHRRHPDRPATKTRSGIARVAQKRDRAVKTGHREVANRVGAIAAHSSLQATHPHPLRATKPSMKITSAIPGITTSPSNVAAGVRADQAVAIPAVRAETPAAVAVGAANLGQVKAKDETANPAVPALGGPTRATPSHPMSGIIRKAAASRRYRIQTRRWPPRPAANALIRIRSGKPRRLAKAAGRAPPGS